MASAKHPKSSNVTEAPKELTELHIGQTGPAQQQKALKNIKKQQKSSISYDHILENVTAMCSKPREKSKTVKKSFVNFLREATMCPPVCELDLVWPLSSFIFESTKTHFSRSSPLSLMAEFSPATKELLSQRPHHSHRQHLIGPREIVFLSK